MERNEIRKIWMKYAEEDRDLLSSRVERDIETHRKGYCKIRVLQKDGTPLRNGSVKVTQKSHDFQYGANIFMLDEFPDEELNLRYREEFKRHFNLATVPFYWKDLEPEQGHPRFAKDSKKIYRRPAPELCVEYCEENGVDAKLHCLIYDAFLPGWAPKNDMAAMERLYEERIRQISERYSGRLTEVEVINEMLLERRWSGQGVIYQKRDLIPWAFELARKYFPHMPLVINESNILVPVAEEDYRHPYFLLLENALMCGATIDKIGIQHHCFTGSKAVTPEMYEAEVMAGSQMFRPSVLLRGLDYLAEFGLPLELTEITVPTFGETEEDEKLQADLLDLLYSVAFSHPAMETIVYWNLPDSYAYAHPSGRSDENRCRGGLFHKDMTPKQSALRLREMFQSRWHTDLTLTTDKDGYVEFRGFYGDYVLSSHGKEEGFGIHKNENNATVIQL